MRRGLNSRGAGAAFESIMAKAVGRAALVSAVVAVTMGAAAAAERVEIVWPTPSKAFAENRPIAAFIQHAGSGDPTSGCFGCVRGSGAQFHEGIDIQPVKRDRRGEAVDDVFAAMDGVVSHVSTKAGNSSYGRYVVIEHPEVTPAVYTLYAHLARVESEVERGARVRRGQTIGTMGRSAGGYTIPRDRAHLHFEIGLWLTRDFQAWYDRKKFGSPNEHGLYNGMNLMGFDPLPFFEAHRAKRALNFQQYLAGMQPAVRLRVATHRVPDFVRRYPSLLTKEMPLLVAGWEIAFNWTGLPFAWTPLTAAEVGDVARDRPVVIEANAQLERMHGCKTLVVSRRGDWIVGRDLETVLQQLFGWR